MQQVGAPCLPLLLNGVPALRNDDNIRLCLAPVYKSRVEAICPTTQARRGRVRTPIFVAHGVEDPIVPHQEAVQFVEALQAQNVTCELLSVPGAGHGYDLRLKIGTEIWEDRVGCGFDFLRTRSFA